VRPAVPREHWLRGTARTFLATFIALLAGGCGSTSPLACPDGQNGGRVATIIYATDRRAVQTSGGVDFSSTRSEPPRLQFGFKEVALGPGHRLGKLDPAITLISRGAPDAPRSISGRDGLRRSDAAVVAFATSRLRTAIRGIAPDATSRKRQVLLYVHGFNNRFDEAILKTAQIAGDIGFVDCEGRARGVAIAYSWPTHGGVFSYVAAEENAEWTEQRLTPFLAAVAAVCRAENAELLVVAHSMGARAVIRSLADLAREPGSATLADQLILLAPDIGKGLFDQYAERLLPRVGHMTIYVSARDRALAFSSFLHGGLKRLGILGSTVIAALELTGLRVNDHRYLAQSAEPAAGGGKIDMIDVGAGFASQFGHTYDDAKFIYDLREVARGNTTPGKGARANLRPREIRGGVLGAPAGTRLRYFKLKTD
jgi:esterase/lipase superfamily enzyme